MRKVDFGKGNGVEGKLSAERLFGLVLVDSIRGHIHVLPTDPAVVLRRITEKGT